MTYPPPLHPYIREPLGTGTLRDRSGAFLRANGHAETATHCDRVAVEARRLARRFDLDPDAADAAGLLHDISAVIPNAERLQVAEALGLAILDAERELPMIVHQRLSGVMAQELFGVNDPATLSAIGCHTTLKRDASALDRVVFVADKISWDQFGDPPYLKEIVVAVEQSLEAGAYCYLEYLFERRTDLEVVHPWAWDAYTQLRESREHWGP
ncbi:MAG: bis(5'-nucleosyl)-tetraphosphatase (symmetrical) YqeK [Gemmatimonadaceae bacterium]|nr:bis(5'-nucleosyl)-tetraphosphatase (symmetrical) YqeK [Gemmatimonadaceae bacterium]